MIYKTLSKRILIFSACNLPPPLKNGKFAPSKSEHRPGSIVTYECLLRLTLVGKNQNQCLENGHWSIEDINLSTKCITSENFFMFSQYTDNLQIFLDFC